MGELAVLKAPLEYSISSLAYALNRIVGSRLSEEEMSRGYKLVTYCALGHEIIDLML